MTLADTVSDRISENLKTIGEAFKDFAAAMPLSRSWIEYAWSVAEGNLARPLLTGAKIALFEAGTSWGIGSNRGAAASIRTFVENSASWLYYKDHSIEYRVMMRRDDDLLLPKAVKSYLQRVDPRYEKAYLMISHEGARPSEYFYSDISQFVHAHPSFATLGNDIAAIAISTPRDSGFLKMCNHTDEFISDVYSAYYRNSWESIPAPVRANLQQRLGSQLAKFLEL